jgi:(p)ppGpp synthase/HD superfamily hydrolase
MNEMSTNVPTIADAIALAAEHHRGTDKGGAPYILHPIRVMLAMTTDEARRVAVLHDLLEDTKVTAEDLRKRGYPEPDIEALQALTRKKEQGETYEAFVERVRTNPLATIVKRADLVDNMDIRRLSEVGPEEAKRLAKYLRAWKRLQGESR